jgi:O-antigen ligase
MRSNEFNPSLFCYRYALVSTCILALCVSLGTALVSLAKALVLLGFFVRLVVGKKNIFEFRLARVPRVFFWMAVATTWMLISMTWSHATVLVQWQYFYAHTRFLWVGVIYFQIGTKERGLKVLMWLIYGQIFVLCISWLLWLGVEVPLTRRPTEVGIAFTSTLEQPVMVVLVLVVLWNFREYWAKQWRQWFVRLVIILMALNMIFVMSGRTGYLVFLLIIAIEIYKMLPKRLLWIAFLSPFVLSAVFYIVSPTFHKRVAAIDTNTVTYFQKETLSSEGQRLDMWKATLQGILKKPILGYGIGSMQDVYEKENGLIKSPVTQPHQQYLFWWAEFGLVGLVIMLGFFYALIKDSCLLDSKAKSSMLSAIAVLFVMGLFNCPFFGVGMGEFFFLEIAALLAIRGCASTNTVPLRTRQTY